jgi:hypothetical protein
MTSHIRAYGGWRERKGFGVGSLTGPQTAMGLALVLVVLMGVLLMPSVLPLLVAPTVVSLAAVGVRVRGESLAGIAARHMRWAVYRRGADTQFADSPELPGVLSGLEVREVDGLSLVCDPGRRTVTVLIPVEPVGTEFMDADDIRAWIAGWGGWLAHLGYISDLAHVQVTVHGATAVPTVARPPDGTLAERVLADLNVRSGASFDTRTVVSLTLKAPRGLDTACHQMADLIATMDTLNRCGVTVLPPSSSSDIIAWIRTCFDPFTDHGSSTVLSDARPTATQEHWESYRHDAGVSAAFVWDDCPGENISAHTLTRLLGPAGYVKRISLVFEPMPAHQAAREVDRQTQAATFRRQYRRRIGRDETARDRLDMQRAQQTAHEQASGSGLVDVGMYAVVTAQDSDALREAATDLHNRAGESRIRLRRAHGTQAQCFAVTLGLGYVPARRW